MVSAQKIAYRVAPDADRGRIARRLFPDVGAGCQLFARVQFRRFAGAGENAATASVVATTPLFIDRWVGIEGVLAVASSDQLGWPVWREAWQERFDETQFSLYDRRFVSGHYASVPINTSRNHFVNLRPCCLPSTTRPAIVPVRGRPTCGGMGAAGFEILTYHLKRQELDTLFPFAQVVAFRFASFGYVPAQSYLLFGSLLLNILALAVADKMIVWHRRHSGAPV